MNHRMGINIQNAIFCHIHLVFSNRTAGCNNLAVNIGQTHFIIIDKVQGAHTASCQRLHGISTHAADTENSYSGICQAFHILFSK